jgi:hypothetical protein
MNLDSNLQLKTISTQKVALVGRSTAPAGNRQSLTIKKKQAGPHPSETHGLFSDSSSDLEIPQDDGIPRSLWPFVPAQIKLSLMNSCGFKKQASSKARAKPRLLYTPACLAESQPISLDSSFNIGQNQKNAKGLEGCTTEIKTTNTQESIIFEPGSMSGTDSPAKLVKFPSRVGTDASNGFSTSEKPEYQLGGNESHRHPCSPQPKLLRRVNTDRKQDVASPLMVKIESGERISFLAFKSEQQKISNLTSRPKSILSIGSLKQSDPRETINSSLPQKKQVRFSTKCTVLVYNKL